MRNLKKILALVLALVMSLSLVTIAGATDYQDENDISTQYAEAVEVLSNLGVFEGTDATTPTFNPKKSITRAEVAAIIYRINTGDTDDSDVELYRGYNYFTDNLPTWAAGYINYCANAKLFEGVGNGQFAATREVTGYEVLAVMLRAMGFEKNEFTGSEWRIKTASRAESLGLTKGISTAQLAQPATRELVAEILFRTITAPTAEYNLLRTDYTMTGASIGAREFGLAPISGEVTAVDRANGTATIVPYADYTAEELASGRFTSYVVSGTDIDWTDIGYAMSVWGVPNGNTRDTNKYAAISTLTPIGVSLKVVTKGDGTKTLLEVANANKVAVAAINNDTAVRNSLTYTTIPYLTSARIYFNGERLPIYADKAEADAARATGYYYNQKIDKIVYAKSVGDNLGIDLVNGLKIDYIDNDNGGEAEVIVVTEYTPATVVGIANDRNTGNNAIVKDTYYFDAYNLANSHTAPTVTNVAVKEAALESNGVELNVGDVVTYVLYRNTYYVTKSEPIVGRYTRTTINRLTNAVSYVVDGVERELASEEVTGYPQKYFMTDKNLLVGTNSLQGSNVVIYTDPYDNIIKVTDYVSETDYLMVIRANHSDRVHGLAEASVVDAAGNVLEVNLVDEDYYYGRPTATAIEEGEIYAYAADGNVYYIDGPVCDGSTPGYRGGEVFELPTLSSASTMLKTGAYLTRSTTFIDVRYFLALGAAYADTVKVYHGYQELPELLDVDVHYVTDANGFVTLAYITAGYAPTDYGRKFIAYTVETSYHYFDRSTGEDYYELPAIVNGEDTTVKLTAEQYETVKTYGVGDYVFGKNGALTEYTSFAEEWVDITWRNGMVVIDAGAGAGQYDPDNVIFYTLDISKGKAAYKYNPAWGADYYDPSTLPTKAYLVYGNSNKTVVSALYIIDGDVATTGTAATQYKDGTAWDYTVNNNGYVTAATKRDTMNITVMYEGAVVATQPIYMGQKSVDIDVSSLKLTVTGFTLERADGNAATTVQGATEIVDGTTFHIDVTGTAMESTGFNTSYVITITGTMNATGEVTGTGEVDEIAADDEPLTIGAGAELTVNGDVAGEVTVEDGGTLTVKGDVSGEVTVGAGSTLSAKSIKKGSTVTVGLGANVEVESWDEAVAVDCDDDAITTGNIISDLSDGIYEIKSGQLSEEGQKNHHYVLRFGYDVTKPTEHESQHLVIKFVGAESGKVAYIYEDSQTNIASLKEAAWRFCLKDLTAKTGNDAEWKDGETVTISLFWTEKDSSSLADSETGIKGAEIPLYSFSANITETDYEHA